MNVRAEKSVRLEALRLLAYFARGGCPTDRARTAEVAKTPVAKRTHGARKIKGTKVKGQIGGPYEAVGRTR